MAKTVPQLSIRIDFDGGRLGPGKVELLEHIARERSIAAAARAMGMSYRRAWTLIETLNRLFREPVVITLPGRNVAGATEVTACGQEILALYRDATRQAAAAAEPALKRLVALAQPAARRAPPPARKSRGRARRT
ncbi:MAG TPA: LysR family transcriptional regulator [Burkholderiaceae bacterium]|jgi:molybdate transport system regulatory protein|nr:LysR family transcriptional regulator [Burkholderiaceae bacterium]